MLNTFEIKDLLICFGFEFDEEKNACLWFQSFSVKKPKGVSKS
ncbi:hypothetical protein AA0488_2837 [Kozakia baliensis NRIC 0488]|nr:hypothetical protein AA0488_2837 [Kozakia baliensis NRIC 0488]